MSTPLLEIRNLHASIPGREILSGIDLGINEGEIHVVMGPNGSGKSTLANVIMNHPAYEVTEGELIFDGEDILEESTDERARRGLFMTFQSPLEVAGITVENFIRSAMISITGEKPRYIDFRKAMKEKMGLLKMNKSYAQRYLNQGFSGGERKKNEMLQMLMLNPRLAILDETDSGLDVDAVKTVSDGLENFLADKSRSVLIITHHTAILNEIVPDFVHILMNGKIVANGDASLMHRVVQEGFAWLSQGESSDADLNGTATTAAVENVAKEG